MIALATSCLLFKMATGESVPIAAEMISVEVTGDSTGMFDSEFVQHAANAVFHYFKHDLGRQTVTVGEFAGALEKVLRDFALTAQPSGAAASSRVRETDLRQLARESGSGCELFFFPRLRDELRHQLEEAPQELHFRGLRDCVKQLMGARRWCARCQTLGDQIVEFLRNCLTAEAARANCSLLVE